MLSSTSRMGPFIIMLAASFWAIDALFRTQLTYTIPSASIIFLEHLIGFICLLPLFIRNFSEIKNLKKTDWLNFIALTVVSSVAGGLLFTQALSASFAQKDFITPLLLIKLQPVFVIGLSALFLKEKLTIRFCIAALFALCGSYIMSFGFMPINLSLEGKVLVYVLALGATFCWGIGTILSKRALSQVSFQTATTLRYGIAIPVALIFAYILGQTYNFGQLGFEQIWRFLIIGAVTGGAAAIFIYYWGLRHTQAKVSTIAELIFPLVSLIIGTTSLNPYGAPQTLTMANIIGIILLVSAVLVITLEKVEEKKIAK
ncbi:DMT family transporter [Candidatus Woesebacteria bacterium]|nr:DMT family transporter [Candidatus Woesebacteria bacterium]